MMLENVSSYSPVFGRLKLRILGLQFSIDLRIQRNKNGKHVVSRVESNISPKPSRQLTFLRDGGTGTPVGTEKHRPCSNNDVSCGRLKNRRRKLTMCLSTAMVGVYIKGKEAIFGFDLNATDPDQV